MPIRQQVVALIISVALLVLTVELVRRRKLREEYSVLWVLTSITVFVLAVWYDLLVVPAPFSTRGPFAFIRVASVVKT